MNVELDEFSLPNDLFSNYCYDNPHGNDLIYLTKLINHPNFNFTDYNTQFDTLNEPVLNHVFRNANLNPLIPILLERGIKIGYYHVESACLKSDISTFKIVVEAYGDLSELLYSVSISEQDIEIKKEKLRFLIDMGADPNEMIMNLFINSKISLCAKLERVGRVEEANYIREYSQIPETKGVHL